MPNRYTDFNDGGIINKTFPNSYVESIYDVYIYFWFMGNSGTNSWTLDPKGR